MLISRSFARLFLAAAVLFLPGVARADSWVSNGTANGAGIRTNNTGAKVGIGITGTATLPNRLDIKGSTAVGSYAGVNAAPTDGLIVSGSVGIGTSTVASGDKLSVAGNIKATGSITADGGIKVKTWSMEVPDYVFETGHHPMSLSEVEAFVNTNKHLPEVPSAATMRRQGMDLVEMNLILLKKVEELTIYMIQQDKKLAALQSQQSK